MADIPLDPETHFPPLLLTWYSAHKRDLPWRRLAHDPYAVWVSEIMLQQTTVAAVIPFFERWMARFPTLADLAEEPVDEVLKRWAGLGYYARARNLHKAAREVMEKHGGVVPSDPAQLLTLPGVGRYTAGAILSLAYHADEPILDANVIRVLSRVFLLHGDPKSPTSQIELWRLARVLIPKGRASDFNQAMMELGALVCDSAAPRCGGCPVKEICRARLAGTPTAFPEIPAKKPWRSAEHVSVSVRNGAGEVLLVQRPPDDPLWGGLWELPRAIRRDGESLSEVASRAVSEAVACRVEPMDSFGTVKHVVANCRIVLHGFEASSIGGILPTRVGCAQWAWAKPDAIEYAMATPQRRLIAQLNAHIRQGRLDLGQQREAGIPAQTEMNIAIAIIQNSKDGTVLIAQRGDNVHLANFWEFPGGKCLPGEPLPEAVVRETFEEVGLNVHVVDHWPAISHAYPGKTVTLYPFVCKAENFNARPIGNKQIAWVKPESLDEYEFPEANAGLIRRLQGKPKSYTLD